MEKNRTDEMESVGVEENRQTRRRRLVEKNSIDEMETVSGEEQDRRDGVGWWRRTG